MRQTAEERAEELMHVATDTLPWEARSYLNYAIKTYGLSNKTCYAALLTYAYLGEGLPILEQNKPSKKEIEDYNDQRSSYRKG